MSIVVFFLVSCGVYLTSYFERRQQLQKGKGLIRQEGHSFLAYYFSAGINWIGYEMYLASIVFVSFLVSAWIHVHIGLWIVTIVSFYVMYRVLRQIVIRKSHRVKMKVDQITPNLLHMLATAYAASSKDVTQALRTTIEQIEISALRIPLVTFIDGIQEGGDPAQLAEITKLYFRNRLLRQLIDAITEEKLHGGLFGDRLTQLIMDAERQNEVENQTRTITFDSTLAAYFVAIFTMAFDLIVIVLDPSIIQRFKETEIGIALVTVTIFLVGFSVIIADNYSMAGD